MKIDRQTLGQRVTGAWAFDPEHRASAALIRDRRQPLQPLRKIAGESFAGKRLGYGQPLTGPIADKADIRSLHDRRVVRQVHVVRRLHGSPDRCSFARGDRGQTEP